MRSRFAKAIHRCIPKPCSNRPFVCDGLPESCTTILIGENPATSTNTDWWNFWSDSTGFDLTTWNKVYVAERRRQGKSGTSQTRLRINRLRTAGLRCLETNVFMNEQLGGHGNGVSNSDLITIALDALPEIRTLIAHGAEAHEYLAARRLPASIAVVRTKHLRLLSFAAVDSLATSLSAA